MSEGFYIYIYASDPHSTSKVGYEVFSSQLILYRSFLDSDANLEKEITICAIMLRKLFFEILCTHHNGAHGGFLYYIFLNRVC